MANEHQVTVALRNSTLASDVLLIDGERPFLSLACPPPVRTVLAIGGHEDDSPPRIFEVSEVIERGRGGAQPGCFGDWRDAETWAHTQVVGSEHLEASLEISVAGAPSPVVLTDSELVSTSLPSPQNED